GLVRVFRAASDLDGRGRGDRITLWVRLLFRFERADRIPLPIRCHIGFKWVAHTVSSLAMGSTMNSVRHLSFRDHMRPGGRRAWLERKWIRVGFVPVDPALKTRIPDISAVRRKRDPHLLAYAFEDLRNFPELRSIHVMDAHHGIFMALLGAQRGGATVRPGADHLQRQVGIV